MYTWHEQCAALAPRLQAWRRDLHTYPEMAWTEYRTASKVARRLLGLGYSVRLGADAMRSEARGQTIDPESDAKERARAVAEGGDAALIEQMRGGYTALWADLPCPTPELAAGPVMALRFDMDANGVCECKDTSHVPTRDGFASRHTGAMHACGHDGHTAIGLGVAEVLVAMRPQLRGTVRLIFQPAEEGGQGAYPMVQAGAVDNVAYMVGLHLGIRTNAVGEVVCGTTHFLATTNFEIDFTGRPAHAGMVPQEGRNALMAACAAVQAMQGISRHSDGASRINVGQLKVDGASNVVPAYAWLAGETRGTTDAIDAFVMGEVTRMAQGAALMWHCEHTTRTVSHCPSGCSDAAMTARVAAVARRMGSFDTIVLEREFWASEDFTWFLAKVQEQGGQGVYIQLGTAHPGGHHTDRFDIDEAALPLGVELLTGLVYDYLGPSQD